MADELTSSGDSLGGKRKFVQYSNQVRRTEDNLARCTMQLVSGRQVSACMTSRLDDEVHAWPLSYGNEDLQLFLSV